MGKSVIIVGAGMGGLSAGCYGQMNGYSTKIFEMHDKPGGLCTAWQRKGYTIDGCLHLAGRLGAGNRALHPLAGAGRIAGTADNQYGAVLPLRGCQR